MERDERVGGVQNSEKKYFEWVFKSYNNFKAFTKSFSIMTLAIRNNIVKLWTQNSRWLTLIII